MYKEDNSPYSLWANKANEEIHFSRERVESFQERLEGQDKINLSDASVRRLLREIVRLQNQRKLKPLNLQGFLIYSPENSFLRTFETEVQIQPLGIKGEGLFKLLTVLSSVSNSERLNEIKKQLTLLDWFDDFEVVGNASTGERTINIRDKFLDENLSYFTQKSANEGFLFLLFCFTLFVSQETPSFFAIDNVDASLNPKLCSRLVKDLVALSKKHEKQAILTTHNPAHFGWAGLER